MWPSFITPDRHRERLVARGRFKAPVKPSGCAWQPGGSFHMVIEGGEHAVNAWPTGAHKWNISVREWEISKRFVIWTFSQKWRSAVSKQDQDLFIENSTCNSVSCSIEIMMLHQCFINTSLGSCIVCFMTHHKTSNIVILLCVREWEHEQWFLQLVLYVCTLYYTAQKIW